MNGTDTLLTANYDSTTSTSTTTNTTVTTTSSSYTTATTIGTNTATKVTVLPKGNILKVIIYLFIYLLHVT
jgi:hypothetical protein